VLGTAAFEAGDESPRPFAHRARDELAHALELGRRRRARVVALDHAPHLFGGHVRDRVDRDALPFEAIEVLGERRPVGAHAVGRGGFESVARRRRGALAHHIDGHALPDLALRGPISQQRHLRVRVEIDEARRDDETGRVERPRRRSAGEIADRSDAVTADRDVDATRRRARAVEDLAATNEEVVLGRLRRSRSRVAAGDHGADADDDGDDGRGEIGRNELRRDAHGTLREDLYPTCPACLALARTFVYDNRPCARAKPPAKPSSTTPSRWPARSGSKV
jgi:hypothetical protein